MLNVIRVIVYCVFGFFGLIILLCLIHIGIRFLKGERRKKRKVKPTYKRRSLFLKIFYDFPKAFARDFYQKNPDAMGIHGFYTFCGPQGSGKTIAAIQFIRETMQKYPLINVRSNISISFQSGVIKHWSEIVDVHNGEIGQIDFLDEIQNWFSSMESKNFPPEMLQEITQERKKHKVIAGTSQVFTRMSKALREQCTYLCLPNTFFGCFTVVRVYKPEVDDMGTLIGKKFIRAYCFVHDDDLRACYNTYEKVERLARGGFIPASERTE